MSRSALIAGATGLVGGALLEQLLHQPEYTRLQVPGRRPPPHDGPQVIYSEIAWTDSAALTPLLDVDTVFCCLGTTLRRAGSRAAFEAVDHGMVVGLAQAAARAGVENFLVVSSIGASPKASAFYAQVKGRMEQDVAASGCRTVHIVQPSLLLGDRQESRPGERLGQLAAPLLSPLLAGPLRKYRPVAASDVAQALVQLAQDHRPGCFRHTLPLVNAA